MTKLRNEFISCMRNLVSSVTVVTTDGKKGRHGATVSSFASVTADPPILSICLNQKSAICRKLLKNGFFCINILSQNQKEIAEIFSNVEIEEKKSRFDYGKWDVCHESNLPVLNGAVASLKCRLKENLTFGAHIVFFWTSN